MSSVLQEGFHHRISAERYHADPAPEPSLSSSVAEILLTESPRKAWHSHPRLNKDYVKDEDSKFDIGTAAHSILLEGLDNIVECNFEDWKKNEAKAMREAARGRGKTPLLTHQAAGVRAMVEAALRFLEGSEIRDYWQDSDAELTGIWEEDGVWCRMRTDLLSVDRRAIVDYKSTGSASPEAFSRQIVRMKYHIQDAFYRRGVQQIAGSDPHFFFLAQSTKPPYECSLHACDPALRDIGNYEVERAIGLWRQCIKANKWPSYGPRIHYAMPTTYMLTEHEMRLQEAA